ncbi:hypothetical protein [Lacipirellula limnantheis]|nr:hypothetical protein [Lacipirellula limnantheis]
MDNKEFLALLQSHERSAAISYLNNHLSGTVVAALSSPLFDERDAVYLALSNRPHELDFTHGYEANAIAASAWLEKAMVDYGDRSEKAICIIEDFLTEPSNATPDKMPKIPMCFCNGHALWLLSRGRLDLAVVGEAIRWCAVGRPAVIAFASVRDSFVSDVNQKTVTVEELRAQAVRVERIATDCCDEEGYIVLDRAGC